MNVVYACNNSYVNQTVISMVSLVKHNCGCNIYLVSDYIDQKNIDLMKRVLGNYDQDIEVIDLENILRGVPITQQNRHPRTIYAKLLLDRVLDVEKILYLDSDVVVTSSLEPLFNRNMEKELAAGVLMPYSAGVKERLGLGADDPYICDGVVLFHLENWTRKAMTAACIRHIERYHGRPPMQSEGTLNVLCKNNMGILSPEFNVMPAMLMYTGTELLKLFNPGLYYRPSEIEHVKRYQVMIHFMNEIYNRPWFEPTNHPLKEEYRNIEKDVFHDASIVKRRLPWHTAVTVWCARNLPFSLFVWLYHKKNGI